VADELKNISQKQFIKDMEKAARQFRNPSKKFLRHIMGNSVVLAHNSIRLDFARKRSSGKKKWEPQSPMTLAFKKAAGRGNILGKQSGAMQKAIGPRLKKGEGRISNRDFIRWTRKGYRFGDNMPAHSKYFGKRIAQRWTQKQAAFLMWKLQRAKRIGDVKGIATKLRGDHRAFKKARPGMTHFADLAWAHGGDKDRATKASRIGSRFQKKFRQRYENLSGDIGSEPGAKKKGGAGKIHVKPKREIMCVNGKTVNRMTNQVRNDMIDYLMHPNQFAG